MLEYHWFFPGDNSVADFDYRIVNGEQTLNIVDELYYVPGLPLCPWAIVTHIVNWYVSFRVLYR